MLDLRLTNSLESLSWISHYPKGSTARIRRFGNLSKQIGAVRRSVSSATANRAKIYPRAASIPTTRTKPWQLLDGVTQ